MEIEKDVHVVQEVRILDSWNLRKKRQSVSNKTVVFLYIDFSKTLSFDNSTNELN